MTRFVLTLTAADLDRLHRFRITDDLIALHEIRRVTDREARDGCGILWRGGDLSGVLFPIIGADDSIKGYRVRRDNPEIERGKPKNKYVQSLDKPHLYFERSSRQWLTDTTIPTVFIEAYTSALAIAAWSQRIGQPYLIIATGGCWTWRGTIGKTENENGVRVDEKGPSPDLDHIPFTGRKVIIGFDSNVESNTKVQGAERAFQRELERRGAAVRLARVPEEAGINGPDDFLSRHTDEEFLQILDDAELAEFEKEYSGNKLIVVNASEFLAMQIPAREDILTPILQTQSTSMLFSKRGVGKTYTSLGIACAVGAGAQFLRWKAPKPRRVLYVDGEMPAVAMQERLALIISGMKTELDPEYFRLITPDLQIDPMPSLSGTVGQKMIEDLIGDSELIILDNISTLTTGGKENEAESWLPMQQWVLSLRRRSISVLLIHHAGRNGEQRGTSRREDVLDTMVTLRHPDDYKASDGARFEIHFTKSRNIHGVDAEPFEVRMHSENGAAIWTMNTVENVMELRVRNLIDEGLSIRGVAKELGVDKGIVERMMRRSK